jgi:hypothetical protein
MAKNLNKDTVYRNAKPKEKDYSIHDGEGLGLLVKTTGVKRWLFVYRFDGKQNRLGLGVYPDTSTENARRQIAEGTDPAAARSEAKKARQLARLNDDRVRDGLPILDSFADITRRWLDSIAHITKADTHTDKTSRIERLAFPVLGDKPIKEIKPWRTCWKHYFASCERLMQTHRHGRRSSHGTKTNGLHRCRPLFLLASPRGVEPMLPL